MDEEPHLDLAPVAKKEDTDDLFHVDHVMDHGEGQTEREGPGSGWIPQEKKGPGLGPHRDKVENDEGDGKQLSRGRL